MPQLLSKTLTDLWIDLNNVSRDADLLHTVIRRIEGADALEARALSDSLHTRAQSARQHLDLAHKLLMALDAKLADSERRPPKPRKETTPL